MAELTENKKNDTVNKENTAAGDKHTTTPDAQNSKLADDIGSAVHGDTKAVKDVINQAKESAGDAAGKAYGIAAEKATSKIDEQKTNLAQGLSSVADNIHQMGDSLRESEDPYGIAKFTAKYGDTLADQVGRISGYLEKKDLKGLARDVEDFAHKNPALFLGAAFGLGIAAARFFKSGNSNQALMRRPRYERKGKYMPDEHEGVHLPEDLDKQVNSATNQKYDDKAASGGSANAASTKKGA